MAIDLNQNLSNLMKEAQKMQEKMQEAQKQLTELVMESKMSNLLSIKLNGRHYIPAKGLYINPDLIEDEDTESLADMIIKLHNETVDKIAKETSNQVNKITSGLNIPTDFLKKKEEDEDK